MWSENVHAHIKAIQNIEIKSRLLRVYWESDFLFGKLLVKLWSLKKNSLHDKKLDFKTEISILINVLRPDIQHVDHAVIVLIKLLVVDKR